MDARTLKKAAKEYEHQTGLDPVRFNGCAGTTKEKHEALWMDLNWYRVHTEDIARRLSHIIYKP